MTDSAIDKKVLRVIYVLSVIIPIAVGVLMIIPGEWKQAMGISEDSPVSSLPLMHAILNGATFVFLIMAVIAIKNKRVTIHRTFMLIALVLSSLFLVSY